MKNKILILIAMMMVLLVPLNCIGQQDGIIRVKGMATSNGEELNDVEIRVKNINTGQEWITKTNSNGSYDILVPAKNDDKINVKAIYNSKSIEKEFTVHSSQKTYDVNFEFAESVPIKIVGKIFTFFTELDVFTVIFYLLLFLFVLLLIVGILHHCRGYMKESNKYKKR